MARLMVINRGHDWSQALPLSAAMLVCNVCGLRRAMRQGPTVVPCRRKGEALASGFFGPVVEAIGGRVAGRMDRRGLRLFEGGK